ncbi:MAG: radical SAM protein [Nanoarchaeota archaeon]|nr:B12-binding domain-containing radical SAM protein [Nanoarchaeota archaeon]
MEKSKKFKILIIVPRYPSDKRSVNEANFRYQFPFGLAYISAVLKKEGYDTDILNLNHYNGSTEELINKKLDEKKYDFVGSGGNAMIYYIIKCMINSVKKHKTKPKFILGGPIITSEPELIFKSLKPDFAVVGEGEETIVELLDCLEKKKNMEKVKGIIYFDKNSKMIMNKKREVIQNLETLPFPDFDGLEFEKFLKHSHCNDFFYTQFFDYPRIYPIFGSRGCPFNCTFCYHEGRYRKRSIKNIMKELIPAVKKYKINIIYLYDECFSIDKKRLYELCKEIKKLRKEISWDLRWTCQLSAGYVNKEVLKEMKNSGCVMISYGFESMSPEVLKSMRKPITPEQIDTIFKETLKQKMGMQGFFIFGDIVETKETAKITLDWWKKNAKGQIGLGFIQPYPGSEIYNHCLKKGIIKDRLEYIKNEISIDQWHNMTDKMTDKEIKKLKKEILGCMARYCKFVKPISMKKEKENVYEFKVRCPYCGKMQDYKNCFVKNRYSYGFYMTCRNCFMRFFIVSLIQKLGYRYYPQVRAIRDLQRRFHEYFIKKKL